MTNTEFIVRHKTGADHPLFRDTETAFRPRDVVVIATILAAFVGLVLLLAH